MRAVYWDHIRLQSREPLNNKVIWKELGVLVDVGLMTLNRYSASTTLNIVKLPSCALFLLVFQTQMCVRLFACSNSESSSQASTRQLAWKTLIWKSKWDVYITVKKLLKGHRVFLRVLRWLNLASGISSSFACWLCLLVLSTKHALYLPLFIVGLTSCCEAETKPELWW